MNTIEQLLASLGMADNAGGTSSMRLMVAAIVATVLVSKLYLLFTTGDAVTFTTEDIGVLAAALGFKSFQRGKEQAPTPALPQS